MLRAGASTAALVAVYYVLPLNRINGWAAVAILVLGLVGLVGLVIFQVRSIIASPFPALRGIQALATSVPLFLLLFAATYVMLAANSTSNFGERLSHTDGLYFTVTIFSTVGFGDITAKTATARLLVTGQMIGDLIILGLAVNVIVGAVKRGRQRQNTPGQQHPERSAVSQADETN